MEVTNLLFFMFVICIGFFSRRIKLIPETAADALPAVLINICYPAMILQTFTTTDLKTLLDTGLPVVIGTLAITLSLFFGSLLVFRRISSERRPILQFITGVGNVTYVAIPLMSVFLPEEMLFVAILHGSVQDLLIWTIYHQLFVGEEMGNTGTKLKKIISNPCLIAVLAGVLLMVFQIRLPSFLQQTISKLNSATSPLSLLFLGMLIHRYGLFSWKADKVAMLYSVGKVILLPVIITLVLQLFISLETAVCLGFLFGSPAPLTSVVWSKQYRKDDKLAVNCCISSTFLFLAVMSFALFVLTGIGLL